MVVILKIVCTNICGSDQHIVRGRTTAPKGLILGHEITGEVIEVGRDVEFIKVGDLVSVPFNIACGRCCNCKEGKTGICLHVNPARPGAVYGYVDMGGWVGGQADATKTGSLSIRIGLGWAKSHVFTTGQCPVMRYHRQLMHAILYDEFHPAKAVNVTTISLDDAPQGYKDFDKGAAKKFVIDPPQDGGVAARARRKMLNTTSHFEHGLSGVPRRVFYAALRCPRTRCGSRTASFTNPILVVVAIRIPCVR